MHLFLIVIFGIYGSVHLYAFLKTRSALSLGTAAGILLGTFMAAMVFAPLMVRILERIGHDGPARWLAWLAYTWMGFLFLFFSIALLADVLRLVLHAASLVVPADLRSFMPSSGRTFLAAFLLALIFSAYAYHEALDIRTERITISTPRIPEDLGRLRIVQITDVHLGLMVREDRLRTMLRVIQETGPDVLVSTGDLVDGQLDSIAGLPEIFRACEPRYGKYAVTGNHEFYAGIDHSLDVTSSAGFTMLRNRAVTVAGAVSLVGVDDPTAGRFGMSPPVTEHDLLSNVPRQHFTVLLKHMPLVRTESDGLFDLQLSGHTHRGQIFPFRFLVRMFFPRVAGGYVLPGGSRLHVSRGTGTWGPPMRFLAPPEITVIDLVHAPGS